VELIETHGQSSKLRVPFSFEKLSKSPVYLCFGEIQGENKIRSNEKEWNCTQNNKTLAMLKIYMLNWLLNPCSVGIVLKSFHIKNCGQVKKVQWPVGWLNQWRKLHVWPPMWRNWGLPEMVPQKTCWRFGKWSVIPAPSQPTWLDKSEYIAGELKQVPVVKFKIKTSNTSNIFPS